MQTWCDDDASLSYQDYGMKSDWSNNFKNLQVATMQDLILSFLSFKVKKNMHHTLHAFAIHTRMANVVGPEMCILILPEWKKI